MAKGIFERKELQEIRDRAKQSSLVPSTEPEWVRAYQRLEDDANTLDAMFGRTIIKEGKEWKVIE